MSIAQSFGIYHALEMALRKTDKPLTCVDLLDNPEVRKFTDSSNKVSDYLGNMWRRGLLQRYHAPKTANSMARWAYEWKGGENRRPALVPQAPAVEHNSAEPNRSDMNGRSNVTQLLTKPQISISNHGERVVIDLPALKITIETK